MHFALRDATGLAGRLPPGSLDASCPRKAYADDRFYLGAFRRYAPIFKLFWGSGHLKVCVVGIPLGRRLLAQHGDAVRPATVDIKALVPEDYLRSMSPAVHPGYRRLFLAAFRDDLVAPRERELRELMTTELGRLADDTARGAPRARRLYEALDAIALRALLATVLGLRTGDPSIARLADAYRRLGPDGHVAVVGAPQMEAFGAIRAIVAEMLPQMKVGDDARFGDSVLTRLVASHAASIDETVVGNAIYMVERGHHAVRDLMRWLLKHLGEHRAVVSALESDDVSLVTILSEVGSDRGLKDVALHEPDIEEVIRTFYQRRNATAVVAG